MAPGLGKRSASPRGAPAGSGSKQAGSSSSVQSSSRRVTSASPGQKSVGRVASSSGGQQSARRVASAGQQSARGRPPAAKAGKAKKESPSESVQPAKVQAQPEPQRSSRQDKEATSTSLAAQAQVQVTPQLSLLQLQVVLTGKLSLNPTRERLIESMFAGCQKVLVSPLHGGLSGSLVLRTDSVDANGRWEEPAVMKLDTEKEMRKEVVQTNYIKGMAGEGIINIQRGPIYLDGEGAVLLEMAGACWVMPEFYSSAESDDAELIRTLKKDVTMLLVAAGLEKRQEDESLIHSLSRSASQLLLTMGGRESPMDTLAGTESLVATLHELWSVGSPLSNLALNTTQREVASACEAGGRFSAWASDLTERLVGLFLPPETSAEIPSGYEPPPMLKDQLQSLQKELNLDKSKHTKRFSTSFVHELGSDVWGGDESAPLGKLLVLLKKLSTSDSWAEWRPLICHVHGDLNFGNILVDARDSLWLIDVRLSAHITFACLLVQNRVNFLSFMGILSLSSHADTVTPTSLHADTIQPTHLSSMQRLPTHLHSHIDHRDGSFPSVHA